VLILGALLSFSPNYMANYHYMAKNLNHLGQVVPHTQPLPTNTFTTSLIAN